MLITLKMYGCMYGLLFLLSLVCSGYGEIVALEDGYTHSQELIQGKYHIFWRYDTEKITLEIHAATEGWVGFGLSPNGGMSGSDLIIGWVKDGASYLQDRHALGEYEPIVDESQDWELIKAEEINGFTVLIVTRKLVTGDTDDRCITMDTMRVIYAYHTEDPVSEEDGLLKHTMKGSRSMHLISTPLKTTRKLNTQISYEMRMTAGMVADDTDTTYWCQAFKSPVNTKHHIVMIEPIITEGNEAYVHHMVLSGCIVNGDIAQQFHGQHGSCFEGEDGFMENMEECAWFYAGWAIGGQNIWFPDGIGFPIGGEDSPLLFKLEVHYDNPDLDSGIVDTSGLRFWVTEDLRDIEAGSFFAGLMVQPNHIIPPKSEGFVSQGVCGSHCLGRLMDAAGVEEIYIFSSFLHTHLAGSAIRVKHIRDGVELPPIAQDNNYDFNFQDYMMNQQAVKVKKGDDIIVQCLYNTMDRNLPVIGGHKTSDEMCLSFFQYYPRIPISDCISMPQVENLMKFKENAVIKGIPTPFGGSYVYEEPADVKGLSLWEAAYSTKWSNAEIRRLEKASGTGRITTWCSDGKSMGWQFKIGEAEMPVIREPYVEETQWSTCPESNAFQEFDDLASHGFINYLSSILLFTPIIVILM